MYGVENAPFRCSVAVDKDGKVHPSLSSDCGELYELQWHAGVVNAKTGLDVGVDMSADADITLYTVMFPDAREITALTFDSVWAMLIGLQIGAEMGSARMAEAIRSSLSAASALEAFAEATTRVGAALKAFPVLTEEEDEPDE